MDEKWVYEENEIKVKVAKTIWNQNRLGRYSGHMKHHKSHQIRPIRVWFNLPSITWRSQKKLLCGVYSVSCLCVVWGCWWKMISNIFHFSCSIYQGLSFFQLVRYFKFCFGKFFYCVVWSDSIICTVNGWLTAVAFGWLLELVLG